MDGDSRRLAWAGLNGRVGEKLLPTKFRRPRDPKTMTTEYYSGGHYSSLVPW